MKKLVTASAVAVFSALAACGHDDEASSSITFTVSGENTAVTGWAFPPASGDEFAVVDGWEVRFDRILVTVDDIVLTETPDLAPTDQSQTGAVVARAKGPWAVNLAVEGKAETPPIATASRAIRPMGGDHGAEEPTSGRGSSEDKSIRLVKLENLNLRGGAAFDAATRYGFGYRVVAASAGAKRVNLDGEAAKDYDEMVSKGWTTMYVGTATFKGGTACKSSDPAYDWSKLPTQVKFRLGFATPTELVNCQNTDLTGKAFEGEEAQRGVQIDGPTFAQLTFHLEHAFWDTVDHDQAKPFFDQIAASAKNGVVTTQDLTSQDPSGFKDAEGKPLPWRSCLPDVTPKPGVRRFDSGSVPVVGASGDPASGLRNYADFAAYQQSTMGHLNADGLCAVKRGYPSPK
ncbi:MAG: hypothetical protein JST00_25365 [Deltaproteobacteria bacterium]|nr:hypothetical protein [Deltaproteobacteria bacterium]